MAWRSGIVVGPDGEVMSGPVSNGMGDHHWQAYHLGVYQSHLSQLSILRSAG